MDELRERDAGVKDDLPLQHQGYLKLQLPTADCSRVQRNRPESAPGSARPEAEDLIELSDLDVGASTISLDDQQQFESHRGYRWR